MSMERRRIITRSATQEHRKKYNNIMSSSSETTSSSSVAEGTDSMLIMTNAVAATSTIKATTKEESTAAVFVTSEVVPTTTKMDDTMNSDNNKSSSSSSRVCGICFETKVSTEMHRFTNCSHETCRDCIISWISKRSRRRRINKQIQHTCPFCRCELSKEEIKSLKRHDTARNHRKEKFLMFTRILMKYLERKDPPLYERAKHIIRDCVEKHRSRVSGYESVTFSMRTKLRATVGETYWKRADVYLYYFMERRKRQQQQQQTVEE